MSEMKAPDQSPCPKCGAWVDDWDGFGVLRHEACGWCAHPSRTGDVCDICGHSLRATRGEEGQ